MNVKTIKKVPTILLASFAIAGVSSEASAVDSLRPETKRLLAELHPSIDLLKPNSSDAQLQGTITIKPTCRGC